jgi:hypothetical protein
MTVRQDEESIMNDAQWIKQFDVEVDRLNDKLEAKGAQVAAISDEAFQASIAYEERIKKLERELADREAELESYVTQGNDWETWQRRLEIANKEAAELVLANRLRGIEEKAEWTQADEKVFIDASVWMTRSDRDKILQRKARGCFAAARAEL